jgi:hypothetical protein
MFEKKLFLLFFDMIIKSTVHKKYFEVKLIMGKNNEKLSLEAR